VKVARLAVWLLVFAALSVAACKRSGQKAEAAALPVVTEASTGLLFTWVDEHGEFHVEQKLGDVPASSREVVRIADPVKDPPQLDDVFVADLRTPGPEGAYPVRTMSRREFEKLAVDRRKNSKGVLEARGASSAPPVAERSDVIIYGASWCGACHQAAAYLKRRGVAFIEKDIEEDSGAAREMQAKLAKANMRSGSIPVIDVRGKVFVGFDERSIDRALGAKL
jgi:glutaredoxin